MQKIDQPLYLAGINRISRIPATGQPISFSMDLQLKTDPNLS